ncbi:triadin-like isoform X2 [Hippocampus zosterae]|uniref:triadin-like isoform X2 n=1 Tax=Hippocampus zosterae TaxID=109293 RepID=UPI00223E7BCD|nr:triadin-like isoform X2 [Hippocampus zosterae]
MVITERQTSSKSKLPPPPMSSQTSSGEAVPPPRANQKTILDDVILTFSSPMAWLLMVALIITWAAVAVVVFDLLDYKTLAGGVRPTRCRPSEVANPPPQPQESTDWMEIMWTLAASLVAPDEEEEAEALHSEEF